VRDAAGWRLLERNLHHSTLLACLLAGTAFSAWVAGSVLAHLEWTAQRMPGPPGLHALALCVSAAAGAALTLQRAMDWRRGRWTSTRLAAFRVLFVALVLAVAADLAWLQPFTPLSWAICAAEAFGAAALVMLAAPRAARWVPPRALRAADFALFNLCLAAILLESGLRTYAALQPSWILGREGMALHHWVRTFRLQPGRLHFGFPCNSRGYYDEEPEPAPRERRMVVAIGDSFSLGVVPHPWHFTTVCERELQEVDVYNVGIPGAGPRQYLHLLQSEALPLRPERVVVALFIGNDVVVREPPELRARAPLLDREQFLIVLLPVRIAQLRRERRELGAAAEVQGRKLALQGSSTAEIERAMPWLDDPSLEQPTLAARTFIELESVRALDACAPDADYRPLFAWLERMIRAAGSTPIAIMLIPDEFQVEDPLWEEIQAELGDRELERFAPQRRVTAWLAERGVPCLDLLEPMRAVEPSSAGRRRLYHLQDTHLNARGNHLAGEALARFLRGL